MGAHGFHRTGLPATVARNRYSSTEPRGRDRSLTTPPTTPREPTIAIAVSTATTAVRPRRRRGADTAGASAIHLRSGRGGTRVSGRRGAGRSGGREGSMPSIVGGVSAKEGSALCQTLVH